MFALQQWFLLILLLGLSLNQMISAKDTNSSENKSEIIRIIQPGVFDVKSSRYLVRMRAWGVSFPKRGQPGYEAALAFTEKKLISTFPQFILKREFDELNLKVVDIKLEENSLGFSHEAITYGVGWHNETETNRYGPYLMAQLKAKRLNAGIWSTGFDFQIPSLYQAPSPKMSKIFNSKQSFIPRLSYWVSSLGKIHRPGCSFYERGRGILTSKPSGNDCRICGGRKSKKR